MGLAGRRSVMGEINAHIWLCLPDRAQAQHLLGCVCARLCERLEPKALTTHYTADKTSLREGSFPQAMASSSSRWLPQICFLVKHRGASRHHANVRVKQRRARIRLISVSVFLIFHFPIIPASISPPLYHNIQSVFNNPMSLILFNHEFIIALKTPSFVFPHTLVLLRCTSD